MKIKFLGGASEVTGSCFLLEVNDHRVLLDCGLFQGHREESNKKNKEFAFDPTTIDAVILSHAHIDHSGRLPLLVKQGFRGPIYSTSATEDLCQLMLLDSAFIQQKDAEYWNKKFPDQPIEPLYTEADARLALEQFANHEFEEPFQVVPGVDASFHNSGHILGSSMTSLTVKEGGKSFSFVYTGDIGRKNIPIVKDPYQIQETNYLVIEGTYGDRFHEKFSDVYSQLEEIILSTISRGGKVIIPAFALERTQEIIYALHVLHDQGKIPNLPVYVDSPLAGNITEVFSMHQEYFDQEAYGQFVHRKNDPFGFEGLRYITQTEESKALNLKHGPMIIISAAGMCENGRILHHLKNNIDDPRNVIVVVGFMAKDTLGRKLVEHEPSVKIFGEMYPVKAQVIVLHTFSGHGDQHDLLNYIGKIRGLRKVFLVHGEETSLTTLSEKILELGVPHVQVPMQGEEVQLP